MEKIHYGFLPYVPQSTEIVFCHLIFYNCALTVIISLNTVSIIICFKYRITLKSETIMSVNIKITLVSKSSLCTLVYRCQRFRGTCRRSLGLNAFILDSKQADSAKTLALTHEHNCTSFICPTPRTTASL